MSKLSITMGKNEMFQSMPSLDIQSGTVIISALRHGKQAHYSDSNSELSPDGVQQVVEAGNANVVRIQLIDGERTVAYYSSSRNRAIESADRDRTVALDAVTNGTIDRTTIRGNHVKKTLDPDDVLDPFVKRYAHLPEEEQRVRAFQDWKSSSSVEHERLGTKSPQQVGQERIEYIKRIHAHSGRLDADHTIQARVWMHETDMYAIANASIQNFDDDGEVMIPHAVPMEIRINAANPEISVQFLGQEGVIYTQNGHTSTVESSVVCA